MAAHSSTIAWRIPWTEEPGGLQPMGSQELDTTERVKSKSNAIFNATQGELPEKSRLNSHDALVYHKCLLRHYFYSPRLILD